MVDDEHLRALLLLALQLQAKLLLLVGVAFKPGVQLIETTSNVGPSGDGRRGLVQSGAIAQDRVDRCCRVCGKRCSRNGALLSGPPIDSSGRLT